MARLRPGACGPRRERRRGAQGAGSRPRSAHLPGGAACRDPDLHAGARLAARLAARQSTRGAGVSAAGCGQPPGARTHHRPRQYREPGDGALPEARSDRRQRLHPSDLRGARRARAAADRHLVRAARRPLRPDPCQLPPARRADRPRRARQGARPPTPKRPWPRCAAAASPCPPSAARACTTRAARPAWRRAWPAPSTWRSSNSSA